MSKPKLELLINLHYQPKHGRDPKIKKMKKRQHATFNHMLEHIKHDNQIFQREEMKYLREFVNNVESQHDIYPCNPVDITTHPVLCSKISHLLTKK